MYYHRKHKIYFTVFAINARQQGFLTITITRVFRSGTSGSYLTEPTSPSDAAATENNTKQRASTAMSRDSNGTSFVVSINCIIHDSY